MADLGGGCCGYGVLGFVDCDKRLTRTRLRANQLPQLQLNIKGVISRDIIDSRAFSVAPPIDRACARKVRNSSEKPKILEKVVEVSTATVPI